MNTRPAPLRRIAAIHDMSGLGKCSLTVALPVISASGVECACIPTALLSTHTGEFKNFTVKDLSEQLLPIAEHWHAEGAHFDGIYSGYLASPEQEALLEQVIDRLADEKTFIIVDPVMADNGKYYHGFDGRMCAAFKSLCRRADIITPNITEAALLTGLEYLPPPHDRGYVQRLLEGLAEFNSGVIAITGVHLSEYEVGSVALDTSAGGSYVMMRPVRPGVFYGTGDLFTSALSALLIRGARLEDALETASHLVADAIDRTCKSGTPRRFGVDFERALPDYISKVATLFAE